jgi:hypothetical protein
MITEWDLPGPDGDWRPLTPAVQFTLGISGIHVNVPCAPRPDRIENPPPVSIAARKNSVSAPFEHITWDEFRQCELRFPPDGNQERTPFNAIGPEGLKLFYIHIALGLDRPLPPAIEPTEEVAPSPRQKCQRWLQRLMTEHPDRSPESLPKLAQEAQEMFPRLSERAFYDCLSIVQLQTGNRNWSKGGRRPKPPHKPPQKK